MTWRCIGCLLTRFGLKPLHAVSNSTTNKSDNTIVSFIDADALSEPRYLLTCSGLGPPKLMVSEPTKL